MNTPNRPGEPGPWSRRRPGLRLPLPLPPPLPSATSVVADIIAKNPPSSPAIADLVRIERIGNGSGGTVWKVQHRVTGKIYALKHVHGHHDDDDVLRNIRRELDILRNTDDPYVVHCHGLYNDDGEIQILLEYMDGGSLEGRHIADEAQLAEVARQVLDGLAYLHRRRVVHRDMKPANLLINSAGKVKIADFGVSRILSRTIDPCMSSVGTVAYMSPERISAGLNDGTYDGFAGDVWSFGLSILELYLGYFPFRDQLDNTGNWTRLMMAIVNGAPPEAPASASPEFRDFISCCLKKEPGRRVKPANLVRHRFLTRMPQ